jgi:hypothetical protein
MARSTGSGRTAWGPRSRTARLGTVVLDVRRGDGSQPCFNYTEWDQEFESVFLQRRVIDELYRAGRTLRRSRLFGQFPGRNKLKAGNRLLVSPFPEINSSRLCCGVL